MDGLLNALNALPGGPIQTLPIQATLSETDPLHQSYAALRLPEPPQMKERVTCPARLFEALHRLAMNTYVPATEESRAGAGAGLTDTD